MEEQGWQIVKRTKTPQEIREEYEQLAKEREERKMQQRTNPSSRLQVTVNATDLFERYMYDETYDDVIEPILPTLVVTEVAIGQTIEVPLTNTNKVILSGNVASQNGSGSGSVGCTFRRVSSMKSWQEFDVSFGAGPSVGAKFNRSLTTNIFANVSGTLQFTPRGLKPVFNFSVGNHLGKNTMGYLTFSSNWTAKEVDDDLVLIHNQSGMSTMLVRDTEKYYTMAMLQFGIPHTYLVFALTRKFETARTRLRGSLKLGTFGAMIEYGVERRVSTHSTLGATMVVGIPVGVTLRVKLVRASQTYTFPLHLSDEILLQPLFYGTVTPLIVWYTLKKLIFDPLEAKKKAEERQKQREANLSKLAEARKDALASVDLMTARYSRIVTDETSRNGLVILIALYGRILSETEELLVNLDSVGNNGDGDEKFEHLNGGGGDRRLAKFPNLDLKSRPDVIDVTIPIQCLVEDGGKLTLYDGGSKTDLAGFYDPCAPTTLEMIRQQEERDPEKHLLIRYLYQNLEHQVIIGDSEGVKLPKTSHKLHRQIPR